MIQMKNSYILSAISLMSIPAITTYAAEKKVLDPKHPEKKNVILILTDDMRFDMLNYAGGKAHLRPHAGHGGQHLKAGLLLLGGKAVKAHVVLGDAHHGINGGFLAHAGQGPGHAGRALGVVAYTAAAEHHRAHAFFDDFSCQTVDHLKPSQFLCRPIFLCSARPSGELRCRAAAGGRNR